jgi:hypothetical protein
VASGCDFSILEYTRKIHKLTIWPGIWKQIKNAETLQSQTLLFPNIRPVNGLIADKSKPDSRSSIAAVGLGISVMCGY